MWNYNYIIYETIDNGKTNRLLKSGKNEPYYVGKMKFNKLCQDRGILNSNIDQFGNDEHEEFIRCDSAGNGLTLELDRVTLEFANECMKQAYSNYMYEEAAEREYDLDKSRQAFSEYYEWKRIVDKLKETN